MSPDEAKVLQLMVNALLYMDETFPSETRLKAILIALETPSDAELIFGTRRPPMKDLFA